MVQYFYVGLGGVLGAICRYLMAICIAPYNHTEIPIETLGVNLLGSFMMTFFVYSLLFKLKFTENMRLAITTGFIGSFTTFSTLSVEIMYLLYDSKYLLALAYPAISFIGGLMLAVLGMVSADFVNKRYSLQEDEQL